MTNNVTLTFHNVTEALPEIVECMAYQDSKPCLFKTIYGNIIIGVVRRNFLGYMEVWTGFNDRTYNVKTEVS